MSFYILMDQNILGYINPGNQTLFLNQTTKILQWILMMTKTELVFKNIINSFIIYMYMYFILYYNATPYP